MFKKLLLSAPILSLLLCIQACTKNEVSPAQEPIQALVGQSKSGSDDNDSFTTRRERTPVVATTSGKKAKNAVYQNRLRADCYDIWDVYYNLYTGEIVGRDYIGRECQFIDDGSGSSGGGGSPGGDTAPATPTPTLPTGLYDVDAELQDVSRTLGNYSATMYYHVNTYQVLNIKVEIDTQNKDLKKVVVTLNGVTWFTKMTQIGDGVLTRYDAATDTYYFKVSTQKELGGVWTTQREIYGSISPSRHVGKITIP